MSFPRTCKFHIWGGQRSTTIYQRVSGFQSNKARADGEHFVPFVFHKICCNLIFCCRSSIPYCRIILCVVQNVVRISLLKHNAYGQYVNVGHICGFAVSVSWIRPSFFRLWKVLLLCAGNAGSSPTPSGHNRSPKRAVASVSFNGHYTPFG